MTLSAQQASSLYGQDVRDRSGSKIGTVAQIWTDPAGAPTWMTVQDGQQANLAPLEKARVSGGGVTVDYDTTTVRKAPAVATDRTDPLSSAELEQLYAHYHLVPQRGPRARTSAPGPGNDLIRSEERLRVGTESQPAGKARLRKQVVTEGVHTTVPVEHDEVYVEREPIPPEQARNVPGEIGEAEQEMTLRAERPIVAKETVPVERVRLAKDEVVEEQAIDDQIRRERVEEDIPEPARRRR